MWARADGRSILQAYDAGGTPAPTKQGNGLGTLSTRMLLVCAKLRPSMCGEGLRLGVISVLLCSRGSIRGLLHPRAVIRFLSGHQLCRRRLQLACIRYSLNSTMFEQADSIQAKWRLFAGRFPHPSYAWWPDSFKANSDSRNFLVLHMCMQSHNR